MAYKQRSPEQIERLQNEYKRLVTVERLTQKAAAAIVGINEKTASRWYKKLNLLNTGNTNIHCGSGRYSYAEQLAMKAQLGILLVTYGETQKGAAARLKITEKTASKWVHEMGGREAVKKRMAMEYSSGDTAAEYIAFMGRSEKYKHLFADLMQGYGDFKKHIN